MKNAKTSLHEEYDYRLEQTIAIMDHEREFFVTNEKSNNYSHQPHSYDYNEKYYPFREKINWRKQEIRKVA